MEGPASDGDSGHTDSEGSVGSMDTMSRESNMISIANNHVHGVCAQFNVLT